MKTNVSSMYDCLIIEEYNIIILYCADLNPCPYNGYFRCGTGECILTRYTCDRFNNCRDGSDEINCSKELCVHVYMLCSKSLCTVM